MSKFGCPEGHTEKIQESFRCWVWFPVDAETGEPMTDHGNEEFDEESFESNHLYYCPTCNETFRDIAEVGTSEETK